MPKANQIPGWFPLDVAGTIYPSARTRHWNSNFRIAFVLKKEVDLDRLRNALADAHKRFPSFFVGVRHGLFWYYVERMDNLDIIMPETTYPCQSIDIFDKTLPALRIYYDRRRVSVEFPHFVTDGGAALIFTKALLARYLQLEGVEIPPNSGLLDLTESPHASELTDSFREFYTKSKSNPPADHRAWQYSAPVIENYLKVIHATIPVKDLLSQAKARDLTLTDYLMGVYLYAFYQTSAKARSSRKPIQISVPISLRNIYPSDSLRNFSLFANLGFCPRSKEHFSFDDILKEMKGKLEAAKAKQELQKTLSSYVRTIDNIAVRLAPNVLKRRVMQAGYFFAGENRQTSPMTNLGKLNLPPSIAEHCETFETMLGSSPLLKLKLAIVSDDRFIHLYFTSTSPKTYVQRMFIRQLVAEGARVRVESNIRDNEERGTL